MSAEAFTDPPIGSPGSPADSWSATKADIPSVTLEADCAAGLFVTQGSADKTAALINDDDDPILGLVVKSEHLSYPSQIDSDGVIQSGVTVGCARTGRRCVFINGTFTPASRLYIRYTAVTGEAVGSVSVDTDAGKNRLIPRTAVRVLTSGTDELGVIDLNLNADADAPAADS